MTTSTANYHRYFRVFNPIFIYLVLTLSVTVLLSYRLGMPVIDSILWLVNPSKANCQNLSNSFGLFWGAWVSYFLAFLIIIFYAMVVNSESKKGYVVSSIVGVIFTSAWFFWAVVLFLFCGLRAH